MGGDHDNQLGMESLIPGPYQLGQVALRNELGDSIVFSKYVCKWIFIVLSPH